MTLIGGCLQGLSGACRVLGMARYLFGTGAHLVDGGGGLLQLDALRIELTRAVFGQATQGCDGAIELGGCLGNPPDCRSEGVLHLA